MIANYRINIRDISSLISRDESSPAGCCGVDYPRPYSRAKSMGGWRPRTEAAFSIDKRWKNSPMLMYLDGGLQMINALEVVTDMSRRNWSRATRLGVTAFA